MPRVNSIKDLRERGHNVDVFLAIQEAGGPAAVAKEFGYKSSFAVTKWVAGRVPPQHVRRLCEMGGNKIKPWQVRPDVFNAPAEGDE